MVKLVDYNANYWKQRIDDCGIRALSHATYFGYIYIAEYFNKNIDIKTGLTSPGNLSVPDINKFSKDHKNILKQVYLNKNFYNFLKGNSKYIPTDMTVEKFIQSNNGRYILYTIPTIWEAKSIDMFKSVDHFNKMLNVLESPPHAVFASGRQKEVYDWVPEKSDSVLDYKVIIAWEVQNNLIDRNGEHSRNSEIKKYGILKKS